MISGFVWAPSVTFHLRSEESGKVDKYKEILKGKKEENHQSDDRQRWQLCIVGEISRVASGVLSATALHGHVFFSSELAALHCSEPSGAVQFALMGGRKEQSYSNLVWMLLLH